MAGGTVSTILSEWLLVLLIVFSLIFEFLLHRVEHWVNHRHQHLQAVVKTLYRELMVLGVVSFSFITYELIVKPDKDTILSFEFAHIFIFLLAIFYTMVVLSTMFASLRLSYQWKHMEQVDLAKYLHQKELYTQLRLRIHRHRGAPWRMVQWWFPNALTLWRYWQLHEMMAFHDIRFQFIFYRNLPEHFRFSSFLRRIKAQTFVHLVESHWSLYVIFLILVLCDIGRRELIGDPAKKGETDVLESVFIIVAAVLLMAIVQVLAIKIGKIYWELTKNPRVYYEGLKSRANAGKGGDGRKGTNDQKIRLTQSVLVAPEDPGSMADDEAAEGIDVPRQYSDTPEAEMLDPMHLRFPSRPGAQFLEGDSGLSKESGEDLPSMSEVTFKGRDEQHFDDAWSTRASIDRRRMDDPRRVTAEPTSPTTRGSMAVDNQAMAVRQSVDISRLNAAARQIRAGDSNSKSFGTKTHDAAHNSSMENELGHLNVDIDMPGDHQRYLAERHRESIRRIGSPRVLSRISSRGVLTDDDRHTSGSEYGLGPVEARQKRPIELASALPRDELMVRNEEPEDLDSERDIESGVLDTTKVAQGTSRPKQDPDIQFNVDTQRRSTGSRGANERHDGGGEKSGLHPNLSLGFMNASILKNLEHQQNAKNMEPEMYPWIMKKLIPRLTRVASPVEKLFWFGSHLFFMWCVEFTLFFSTVLLSAAAASMVLIAIEKTQKIVVLNVAALVLSGLALFFVLFRIAGIIKKYIFILHNAGLVPESLAIQAIQNVNKKGPLRDHYDEDGASDLSGAEMEREDEQEALERRQTLGMFFRSEAEVGNMPGIDVADARRSSVSDYGSSGRLKPRKLALHRRKHRMENAGSSASSMLKEGSSVDL